MKEYTMEDVVHYWQSQNIRTDADLDAVVNGQVITLAYNTNKIDYLFVPNDAFLEEKYQAHVGKKLTVNGKEFPVFIIPEVEYIPQAAAQAAVTMVKAGGEVFFSTPFVRPRLKADPTIRFWRR